MNKKIRSKSRRKSKRRKQKSKKLFGGSKNILIIIESLKNEIKNIEEKINNLYKDYEKNKDKISKLQDLKINKMTEIFDILNRIETKLDKEIDIYF